MCETLLKPPILLLLGAIFCIGCKSSGTNPPVSDATHPINIGSVLTFFSSERDSGSDGSLLTYADTIRETVLDTTPLHAGAAREIHFATQKKAGSSEFYELFDATGDVAYAGLFVTAFSIPSASHTPLAGSFDTTFDFDRYIGQIASAYVATNSITLDSVGTYSTAECTVTIDDEKRTNGTLTINTHSLITLWYAPSLRMFVKWVEHTVERDVSIGVTTTTDKTQVLGKLHE